MGQIITIIDEAGVNELFVKVFNAMPDQGFVVARSGGNAQLQLQLNFNGRVRAQDFAAGARPIDLRGSSLVPPAKYRDVKLRIDGDWRDDIHVAGWSRAATFGASAEVSLAGNIGTRVERQSQSWLALLDFDAAGTSVSFAGNRGGVVDAVRSNLGNIDTNPHMPGRQPLPQPVINAAADLAGQLFDMAAGPAAQAATDLTRALIGNTQVTLGCPLPRRFRVVVPGGGEIDVELMQPEVVIDADKASLVTRFV